MPTLAVKGGWPLLGLAVAMLLGNVASNLGARAVPHPQASTTAPAPAVSAPLPEHVPQAIAEPGPLQSVGGAPPTELAGTSLLLIGTIAFDDPAAGYAIIGDNPATAGLYGSGSEVVPGMMIREIYADRVVVEHAGIRQVLSIAWARAGSGAGWVDSASALVLAGRPAGSGANVVSGQFAGDGPAPGIRVFAGRDRTGFAKLGLRPGDIVTEVNGVAVSGDAADIPRLLAGTQGSTITVVRAGQLQQIALQSDPGTATQ
jgi:general secretion pathway protein C